MYNQMTEEELFIEAQHVFEIIQYLQVNGDNALNLSSPEGFYDSGELKGCIVRMHQDQEQERFFIRSEIVKEGGLVPDEHGHPVWEGPEFDYVEYPTYILNNSTYLTSNMTPEVEYPAIIEDQKRSAAGFYQSEIEDLDGPVLSTSKYRAYKVQERYFHNWVIAICKASNIHARKLWHAFWQKFHIRRQDGTLNDWLSYKQVNLIKSLFYKMHNLRTRNDRLRNKTW